MNDYLFFQPNENFHLFGQQHLLVIALTVAMSISLAIFAKKKLAHDSQLRLGRGITVCLQSWWSGGLPYGSSWGSSTTRPIYHSTSATS
ncbi:MAG: hypothetical protein IPM82_25285 [Saprospiraceae bacterium]|nr:hypothetical protein [Saprospiraceae bacterium]